MCKPLLRCLPELREVEIFVTKAKAISAPVIKPQTIVVFAALGALCLRLTLLLISP